MPDTHSKLAIALAETLIQKAYSSHVLADQVSKTPLDLIAGVIDERLAEIRKHYEPEELARCPIVTHHPEGPCAFCCTSAMREFILVPTE